MKEKVQSRKTFSEKLYKNIERDLIAILKQEANSILNLINNFPSSSVAVIEQILGCDGRIVFTGMGKSGIIGKKLAATFSSVGMSSFFLHPSEALHGDLGMVQGKDLVISLSKSGSGDELHQIIPLLKSQGNYTVLLHCDDGALTKIVDLPVKLAFEKEACQLNLAPTSSSTLMLAFGDALAVVASAMSGFTQNDFAKFHPGGALGKNLLLKVSNLMVNFDQLPLVEPSTLFPDVLFTMTSGKKGVCIVVDYKKHPLGVITDGDLRRACELGSELFEKKALDIMTPEPKTISSNVRALTALETMEEYSITSLVVVEHGAVIGLIHMHDILKAGIRRK